ncbi:hypothetical protein Cri9333_2462 [Crinalium epipsammum PCC 9333]|uniref:Uncharacterized protein n=1 Tax=Crinalium epipsammum PCC 9333 TaxID=1173022 RepID=K9W0L4_9CYAN|nr:hypothetical protein [Crinalium epipsammum]AFZ13329.1 hypothetical protein Cri9333_2462 [Crinalium epipsammum PCC 9333]
MEIEESINGDRTEMINRSLAEVFRFVEDLEQQVKENGSSFQPVLEVAEKIAETDNFEQNESLFDFGF